MTKRWKNIFISNYICILLTQHANEKIKTKTKTENISMLTTGLKIGKKMVRQPVY